MFLQFRGVERADSGKGRRTPGSDGGGGGGPRCTLARPMPAVTDDAARQTRCCSVARAPRQQLVWEHMRYLRASSTLEPLRKRRTEGVCASSVARVVLL